MPLAEHKLLLCTVLQRPFAAPPLHYPAETVEGLTGIFILQHCQQRRWHKRWSRLQPANTQDISRRLQTERHAARKEKQG